MYQFSSDLAQSATRLLDEVAPLGGRGGLIAITSDGESIMPFQTRLMYRGSWKNGSLEVGIGPSLEQ
jgi:isoaspartyl peptidase/L-asparaginase-like protein (Ntn-hydrolase superfamily)